MTRIIGGLSEGHGINVTVASGLLEFTDRQRQTAAAALTGASASGGAFTIRPGGRASRL